VPSVRASGGELLSRVPLFATLSPEDRQGLEVRLRSRRYPRGETLFVRGDPGSYLYIIESGSVKIALTSSEGKEMILAVLAEGDFFGELALLDGEPRSADAVMVDDTRLMILPREEFLRYVESRPRVALHALAVLSRRLRQTDQLVHDAVFFDVAGRLASVILRLAETIGQPVGSGVTISRRLTQVELAEMIGTTRESVNKWLGFYERQGIIRSQRGLITVLQPERLQQRAQ
jgi:CRP/FNR family transcriptional regulator, cyclic AMP receptor protein